MRLIRLSGPSRSSSSLSSSGAFEVKRRSDPQYPLSEEEQVPGGEAEGAQGEKRVHPVPGGVEHDDTQVLRRRSVRSHRRKLPTRAHPIDPARPRLDAAGRAFSPGTVIVVALVRRAATSRGRESTESAEISFPRRRRFRTRSWTRHIGRRADYHRLCRDLIDSRIVKGTIACGFYVLRFVTVFYLTSQWKFLRSSSSRFASIIVMIRIRNDESLLSFFHI